MTTISKISKVYTEDQAVRLAKVTLTQLRYWDRTNFFVPSIAFEDRRVTYSRIYSFDDVVALRVLGELKNKHGVSLQHLRRVRDKFKLPQEAWAQEEIFVNKKNVYFRNDSGKFINAETSEETLPHIPLPMVISEIREESARLSIRPQDAFGIKEQRRDTARKAEVFKGTRIPIDMVKEYFAEGLGKEDILRDYPTLTSKDIDSAIKWLGVVAA